MPGDLGEGRPRRVHSLADFGCQRLDLPVQTTQYGLCAHALCEPGAPASPRSSCAAALRPLAVISDLIVWWQVASDSHQVAVQAVDSRCAFCDEFMPVTDDTGHVLIA